MPTRAKAPPTTGTAAGDQQGVGDQGPDQQPSSGDYDGAADVGGLFEGTPLMADCVRADEGTDEEVPSHRGDREQQGGRHEHGGVLEVEPQPGGTIDRDEPDRRIEQHPHPPMQPVTTLNRPWRHESPHCQPCNRFPNCLP